MFKRFKKVFDITFLKFIIVGVANTLVGTAVMFFFYNFFHLSYWLSSAANYVVGSILSYFLNKNFTFNNKSKDKMVAIKFFVNILVCYFAAYGGARPVVRFFLSSFEKSVQDNLAMLAGMVVFILFNYIGQRFWAFKK